MNIMKFRPLFFVISCSLLLISSFSIWKWGFKQSIDFSGGTVWEFQTTADIQKTFLENNVDIISLNNQTVKFKSINQEEKLMLESSFKKADPNFQELRFETLGPSLGKELMQKTVAAIILSSLFLLLFIGSKFKDFSFGASAILAMFHDAFILIGAFSILGHFFGAELDALFVTALLTTLSASTHDTIVTFDRIRELKRKNIKVEWLPLANQAVSEVIVRSINNSMTIIFMLLALVALGGETTRWFATALLIGVVSGTYSSVAVAIPLVLFWKGRKKH
jgi:preprotein translocase subunit SecF